MIEVYCNGKLYKNFSDYNLYKSLNFVARSFEFSFFVDNESFKNLQIKEDSKVKIKIKSTPFTIGKIDIIEDISDETGTLVKIKGRSISSLIIDCPCPISPGEFKNISLLNLCKTLCGPYNIPVYSEVIINAKLEKWSIIPGETIWENLERASRKLGLLITGSDDGGLVITKVKSTQERTQLIEGQNVKRCRRVRNSSLKYSEYRVVGQDIDGLHDAEGIEYDSSVNYHRPLLIISENTENNDSAKRRALWEKKIREQRSTSIRIETNNILTSDNGDPWETNKTTKVIYPTFGINEVMLISSTRYIRKNGGFPYTEIDLEEKDSYSI
ncbi:hypothetical protein HBN50_07820 [Halobacteriovorax sp. GB3]|uniref:phage baseplate assembly protein n=1 Tax=Halobacteriovorax sp. GB3 TaxID=2719615 RepID=UPI002361ED0C|nr:hypothetical protein [Halobacteriovorax sp. GB3]MDD0852999.1 hypothetical protein [Halobacteriovorax sp. GB3]